MMIDDLDFYDYSYPDDLVALSPLAVKDQANMLVFENNIFSHQRVSDLLKYVSENDLLVFNNTRVLPCRLTGQRVRPSSENIKPTVSVTLNQEIDGNLWTTFCKPLKKLKEGDRIIFSEELTAEVMSFNYGQCVMNFDSGGKGLISSLKEIGDMPLPPYIMKKRSPNKSDFERYQTPFAEIDGSVAAPTASLHFPDDYIASLDANNISYCFITLHVSGGTFLPIREKDIGKHKMHSEYANVEENAALQIRKTLKKGGKVIAIGTTVMRVLESSSFVENNLQAFFGSIDTFIRPGHHFKVCSGLFTNFHLPKSTLYILVNAFVGVEKAKELYSLAIKKRYRLFSYGDCCLLLP
ncbi:MAG: S-adenosylmethionine:tRNA ribosyltransferase-isomerase [Paracoccaceae bacterium]|nr:MAG: S-adenosylmethionine:tRNA ribosyltransferase-isomerase [Paracoccaceae bacterium]